ncbi:MAG TPA: DASS family sodium-coupled anion symporter [Fulvivirga sp.]|nr:DASS family sodium-coupled anion symporter [Fulvivirga sp.]
MRRTVGIILGPLLFIFIQVLTPTSEVLTSEIISVIALAAWMITWWISEAVPIPVTALLPIVVLPLLGIFTVTEATAPYASPIIFLFMGGFMIALGLEKHNLHLRLALNLLKITGTSGNGIILGFMLATALLSMWISNTATAVMMLPLATSVVALLSKRSDFAVTENKFAISLMLCIAYSANIGGTMTLIGTPPNVVMAGYLRQLLHIKVGFAEWMLIGIPTGLILLTCMYFLLTKVLFTNQLKTIDGSAQMITSELNKLGKISKAEKLVLAIFALTTFGWIFKQQINVLFGGHLLTDHITAMIGGILMFSTPIDLKRKEFLMNWEDTSRLPWGILLLFGGGMALANGLAEVGIIDLIGKFVSAQSGLQIIALTAIVTALVLILTEFMSNVALVTILIPVIIGISQGLDINPLILVVPATLASSCAFMMPISTPPNAIVFSSGHIKMRDMLKAGLLLNIISIFILTLVCNYLVPMIL